MHRNRALSAAVLGTFLVAAAAVAAPLHAAPAHLITSAPSVTAVRPSSGPVAGGTRVTLSGTGLAKATAVTFGGVKGTRLHVTSTRQVEVTTPRHAAGKVAVRVITGSGASAVTSASRFTFVKPPVFSAMSPSSGGTAAGTHVVLTGANLATTSYVSFGAARLTPTSVSGTSVRVTAPGHIPGSVQVAIVTTGGRSTSRTYTYVAPAVAALSPAEGSGIGQTPVTITGSHFTGTTSVTFGGVPGTNLHVTDGVITVDSPPNAATPPFGVDVQVHTPYAASATGDQSRYTYGIVDFHILAGTGSGPWNSPSDPVRAYVGETIRFFNDDTIPHRLHSPGVPGPHWASDLAPGGTWNWLVTTECTCTTDPPQLYDHNQGLTAGFYIIVSTRPS
ncbi:IPT/TIG domain-containing protein [Nocardioides ultimimeridianus]